MLQVFYYVGVFCLAFFQLFFVGGVFEDMRILNTQKQHIT